MSDPIDDDPFLWLEDVRADAALTWARERTAATAHRYGSPARTALRDRLQRILEDPDRLVIPHRHGEWMYDVWRDAANPRGLWRRASHASFLAGTPDWQVLVDVDALGAAEGTPWAFAGATLGPDGTDRALVALSPDGGDAHVVREFSLADTAFVTDHPFTLAADKSHAAWLDADTLLVASALHGGDTTDSGYPRSARLWRRGTPLDDATTVAQAAASDVSVSVHVDRTAGHVTAEVGIAHDFFHDECRVWNAASDAAPHLVHAPQDAVVDVHADLVAVRTTTPWTVAGIEHAAGTLLVGPLATLTTGDGSKLRAVFTPTRSRILRGWAWTRTRLVVTVLDDVQTRVVSLDPQNGWQATPLGTGADKDDILTVDVVTTDADEDDEVWLVARGFLTPPTLMVTDAAAPASRVVQRAKAVFDAEGLATTQHWATSADGTRIPYFQIGPRDQAAPLPTVLGGYGGFEVSRLPEYAAVLGPAWLERGRVHVVANIRGGGEFGPAWHLAALRDKRPRAYEDFVAVARDLTARGVTTTAQLGCHGGSNGGLLVGNMLTQYPDDFGAVVCGVPLLDMRRYTRLSAGASWIAEYGDPDEPDDWAFIRSFSPYHLVQPAREYPPSLFYAATSDDRVGPVQARKMVARMTAVTDAEVHYVEQDDGGHAASIDAASRADLQATIYAFLDDVLTRTA